MTRSIGSIVLLAVVAVPTAASAFTAYGAGEWARWNASDRCAHSAFTQFPDYTAESNAKRDAAYRMCLAAGNLPPRELPSPGTKP